MLSLIYNKIECFVADFKLSDKYAFSGTELIEYLNKNKILENKEEILEEFNNSLTYLSEEEWGTPLMLVVKDGEVVGHSNGFLSEETYVEFLKAQGIIGE